MRVWLRGGLGNQLFQYSHGLALSEALSCELEIRGDLLPSREDTFHHLSRWPEQISSFRYSGRLLTRKAQPFGKTHLMSKLHTLKGLVIRAFPDLGRALGYPSELDVIDFSPEVRLRPSPFGTVNLDGYFLSSRLPSKVRSTLSNQVLGASSQPKLSGAFAIHLRLGDHRRLVPELQLSFVTAIRAAVRLVRTDDPNARFVVVSDDPDLACEIVGQIEDLNFTFEPTDTLNPLQVMGLLASSDGLIAGHSTLAWWAGFFSKESARKVFLEPPRGGLDFSRLTLANTTLIHTPERTLRQ